MCLSVCLRIRASAENNFSTKWSLICDRPDHTRSMSKVKVIGRSSRSQDKLFVTLPATDARYDVTYFLFIFVALFVLKWSVRPRMTDFTSLQWRFLVSISVGVRINVTSFWAVSPARNARWDVFVCLSELCKKGWTDRRAAYSCGH